MVPNRKRWYTIGAQFFSCAFCGHVRVIQVNSKDKEDARILFCPVCGVKTTFKLTDPSQVEEVPEEVKNLLKLKRRKRWKKKIVRQTSSDLPSYNERRVAELYDSMSTAMLMTAYGTRNQTFHAMAEAIAHLPKKRTAEYELLFRQAMEPLKKKPYAPYHPDDPIYDQLELTACQTAYTAAMAMNSSKLATRQAASKTLHALSRELTHAISEDDYTQINGELKKLITIASRRKRYQAKQNKKR